MSIKGQGAAYRRGVILGLTLAEIMVLVIFLILLAFAAVLKKEKEKYQHDVVLIDKHKAAIERIIQIIDTPEPDMTEELIKAAEQLPELMKIIKDNKLDKEGEQLQQIILKAVDRLVQESKLTEIDNELPLEEQLKKLLLEKESLKSEVSNLKGQNVSLMKQMGKGLEYPPCWADENGKPEYIFNVDLTDKGIVIHDNKLPNRVVEQSKLPVDRVVFGAPIGKRTFFNQTYAFLKWGQANDCRFFVRVYDQTGDGNKEAYKMLLGAVEGTFYKSLM